VPELECKKIEFLFLDVDRGIVAPVGSFREFFVERDFQGRHDGLQY
jgi:hypothetical protein